MDDSSGEPAFFSLESDDAVPRCPACGVPLALDADAHSLHRRGRVAVLVEWRVCICGVMTRSDRPTTQAASPRTPESGCLIVV